MLSCSGWGPRFWSSQSSAASQQKAIAPIGEAVNLMYGAFGTMALIAGLGPALAAFVLDRQAFRATLADNRQAETAEATAQDASYEKKLRLNKLQRRAVG